MKKLKKILKKIRSFKLNFLTVIVVLTILLVIFIVFNVFIYPSIEQSRDELIIDTSTIEGENPGNAVQERFFIDNTTKTSSLLSAMPYYSDAFNITYSSQDGKFKVYINPASKTTYENVLEWLKTFPDVNDPNQLNIDFIDMFNSGAPTTTL